MTILITGASGLLGHDVTHTFEQAGHKTIKLCMRPRTGYTDLDITSESELSQIRDMEFSAIVHTAAWRTPDQCMNDKDGAYKINVWASEQLAKIAKDKNVPLIYISTDYVFSGEEPPYAEDSSGSPVNDYGKTKLLGEQKVIAQSASNIILRIPFLYGIRAGLKSSHLLSQTIDALNSETPWAMDHTAARYPTYTGDVADTILFLLEKNSTGIFHFSGFDRLTRYEITSIFAELMHKPMTNIVKQIEASKTQAARPKDSHLASDKIHNLGLPKPLSFKDRIAKILYDLPI